MGGLRIRYPQSGLAGAYPTATVVALLVLELSTPQQPQRARFSGPGIAGQRRLPRIFTTHPFRNSRLWLKCAVERIQQAQTERGRMMAMFSCLLWSFR